MAPNFLSKFVKSTGTLAPFPSDGTSPDSRSRTSSDSGYHIQRGRTISGAIDTSLVAPPNFVLTSENDSPVQPSTPGSLHRAGSPVHSTKRGNSASPARSERSRPTPISTPRKAATELVDMPHTTSPESDLPSRGPSLDMASHSFTSPSLNTVVAGNGNALKHKTSAKSLRSLKSLGSSGNNEDAAAAAQVSQDVYYPARRGSIAQSMHPIVESPKSENMPDTAGFSSFTNDTEASNLSYSGSTSNITVISASSTGSSLQPRQLDSDSISVASSGGISTNVSKDGKKLPWRRTSAGSGKKRKPTGLASAIAASGLAMANPGFTQPLAAFAPPPPTSPQKNPPRRSLSRGPRRPSNADRTTRSRQASATYMSDEALADGDFQSDGGTDSEDELDLNDEDIPVTGFAVANVKRNTEFHDMFPTVPEGDYLIEDYGCALQKEILIQGRMYISENHICFHANIFGWITDLIIPVYEIISIEKKMTALFIPNAIQLSTRTAKHTFASFLSRDTTYDVIYNVWRLARPDAESLGSGQASARVSFDEPPPVPEYGDAELAVPLKSENGAAPKAERQKVTQCKCGRERQHFSETAMIAVFPGTPEKIYNLMFTSGFIKEFMRNEQQLKEIQISDWCPDPESGLLSRNFSYIKPLTAPMGPKQTRCELLDETVHCDFNDYISTLTTTRTPEVPSGGAFSVKTRTCIMWASSATTKVIVTTQVDWTGRSFIKSIINSSAIDGQKTYHVELEKAMRDYIAEHKTEFIPEGMEAAAVALALEPAASAPAQPALERTLSLPGAQSEEDANKRREHERNQRATQWAFDTVMGAWTVARQSTSGALELLSDAWDQSSSTTILWFVIVVLVLSNAWTLKRSFRSEEIGRRKEMQKIEDQRKTVANIAAALLDEQLAAARSRGAVGGSGGPGVDPLLPAMPFVHDDWKEEVHQLNRALDTVEERVRHLRRSLEEID